MATLAHLGTARRVSVTVVKTCPNRFEQPEQAQRPPCLLAPNWTIGPFSRRSNGIPPNGAPQGPTADAMVLVTGRTRPSVTLIGLQKPYGFWLFGCRLAAQIVAETMCLGSLDKIEKCFWIRNCLLDHNLLTNPWYGRFSVKMVVEWLRLATAVGLMKRGRSLF